MKKELKHLIGVKVESVNNNMIYFEDGTNIEFHPYETYVYKPKIKPVKPKTSSLRTNK